MEFRHPSEDHLKVLRERFQIQKFKDDQWKIIRSVMYDLRDTSIVASTGFGKSLTYQFPAVYFNKITLVVSPLISLMQDQVASLLEKGIAATYWCSEQLDRNVCYRFHEFTVIYITPDSLLDNTWIRTKLLNLSHKICLIAIDEAHVIDTWKDFRPIMLDLGDVKDLFRNIPILTLTATSPIYIENFINKTVGLTNPFSLRLTLNRPNLRFDIRPKGRFVLSDILPLVQGHQEGSIIIYVITVSEATSIATALENAGIVCSVYHSKVEEKSVKKKVLNDFRSGLLKVVVCTIAFGMGIDRRDVRKVIHYGMPRSIEGYYQEAGRAGRDGNQSECIMFYSRDDEITHRGLILNAYEENINRKETNRRFRRKPKKEITKEQRKEFQVEQQLLLEKMIAFINSKKCRRLEMLQYLGARENEYGCLTVKENCCDNCMKALNGQNSTIPLSLLYEGVRDDNKIDLSEELRCVLKCVNKGQLTWNDTLSHILGNVPSHGVIPSLEVFGLGRNHERDWWNAFTTDNAVRKYFITIQHQILKLTRIGKSFLRFKMKKIILTPNEGMRKFMKKRSDLEYYWDENEIKSRPKINLHDGFLISNKILSNMSQEEILEVQNTLGLDLGDADDDVETVMKTISKKQEEEEQKIVKMLSEEFNDNDDEDVEQLIEPPIKIQKLN